MQVFPGDPTVRVSPAAEFDADGYRVTEITCGSHTGTHVDAPAHTEPDGQTLDEFPIERFVMDSVLVDCRDLEAREPITPDLVPETDADCIVFMTGWDRHWGSDRYHEHPYLAPETAQTCARGGYDVGIDTLNPDPTPSPNARESEPEGFQAHHALLGNECLVVENLTRLDRIPARFELHVYPLALGGDGAPVRAVGVEYE